MEYDEEGMRAEMDNIISLYINPSIGSPDELRNEIMKCESGEANQVAIEISNFRRVAFEDFLMRKYMDVVDFDQVTNGLYMKNKEAIYRYMQSVYNYAYNDGPMPDWKDYVHPDYIPQG